jgi:hypothetical protein
MENEVTCDHGMYCQFMFVNYLAEKISESIPMVQDSTRCRVIKGELKGLNGSIVSTCWDKVFLAHTLDGYHLYKCGGAISYET